MCPMYIIVRIFIIRLVHGIKGVKLCRTSYCIKIRTDCKYENIDPLIQAMKDNIGKIVSINTFFRPVSNAKYHPSDYMLAMSTDEAMRVTNILLDSLTRLFTMYPEQRIGCSIMEARGYKLSFDNNDIVLGQMREVFTVVDVNKSYHVF